MAKFRENETLADISEFTVVSLSQLTFWIGRRIGRSDGRSSVCVGVDVRDCVCVSVRASACVGG